MESVTEKTATFVKRLDGNGEGRVYRLDPPMQVTDWNDESKGSTEYVWVSAANVMFSGPETYIFACNKDGDVADWGELPGSYRGGMNHESALEGAGYSVVESAQAGE